MTPKEIREDCCKRLDKFSCELLKLAEKEDNKINDYFIASTLVMNVYTKLKMKGIKQ